jgi:hypothetical protein
MLKLNRVFFTSTLNRTLYGEIQDKEAIANTLINILAVLSIKRTSNILLENTLEFQRRTGKNKKATKIILAGSLLYLSYKVVNFMRRVYLENELTKWKESIPSDSWVNVDKVVNRISYAINDSWEKKLDLSLCSLIEVPPIVWKLKELTDLNLSSNLIVTLPPEIGRLEKLEELDLSSNHIEVIPLEIARLEKLKRLSLSSNHIVTLPREIGQLQELTNLNLSSNQIVTLPPEIGRLEKLEELDLSSNQIINLPSEVIDLPYLAVINLEGTAVPLSEIIRIDNILVEKMMFRYKPLLPKLLEKWKDIIKLTDGSLNFIEALTPLQRSIISDWLLRIEKTPEFKKGKKEDVAKIVCEILKTVGENPTFSEDFFAHTAVNNTGCEDHAGMALNEVYSRWKVASLSDESTLEDKVLVLLRAIKTYTFRLYIARWLHENEPNNSESVEVFLFYENLLRKDLDLLSAVGVMTYNRIGNKLKRLPKAKVIEDVNKSYLENIFEVPRLEELLDKEEDFIATWKILDEGFENELEEVEDKLAQGELQEQDYASNLKSVMCRKKGIKREKIIEWLQNKSFLDQNRQIKLKQNVRDALFSFPDLGRVQQLFGA